MIEAAPSLRIIINKSRPAATRQRCAVPRQLRALYGQIDARIKRRVPPFTSRVAHGGSFCVASESLQLNALLRDGRNAVLPLWGRDNILKRQLVHVGAFNLSLILCRLLGAGTLRELRNRFGRRVLFVYLLFRDRINQDRLYRSRTSRFLEKCFVESHIRLRRQPCRKPATCATDC